MDDWQDTHTVRQFKGLNLCMPICKVCGKSDLVYPEENSEYFYYRCARCNRVIPYEELD